MMDYKIHFITGDSLDGVDTYITKDQKDIIDALADQEGKVYIINSLKFTIEVVRN